MDNSIIPNISKSLENGETQEDFRYEGHPSPAAPHVLFEVFKR
jgi:hypothetical protein